jgi:alpha-galactosidase
VQPADRRTQLKLATGSGIERKVLGTIPRHIIHRSEGENGAESVGAFRNEQDERAARAVTAEINAVRIDERQLAKVLGGSQHVLHLFKQDRGLTWDDPFFVLRNDARGEYFFGQLAWPASYLLEFQKDDGLSLKTGPLTANALRVLAAGETIASPGVHLGCVKGDFDATARAMHDHIRRSVLPRPPAERSCRVQYIHPEDQPLTVYLGDAYNETGVKKCMDVAAATGMEVFIVDGPTWCSAYGNWLVPDTRRFPGGLKPLVEYAHRTGLLFALYAEPEGGREGYTSVGHGATIGPWSWSKVFREHSDWFVQPQSVLNLAIPEAAAYMEAELGRIIEHYGLDLYRHDFNAPQRGEGSVTPRNGFVESDYWRHYEALGGIVTRVRGKYPNLILQQASAGGTRLELDALACWHEHYTSDRASFPEVAARRALA